MSDTTQTNRLVRVKQKMRTDLFPDPPLLPDSFIKRFPELDQFNREMRRFVEQLRNCTETE